MSNMEEKSFYRKLYVVIGMSAAISCGLIYLIVSGSTAKIQTTLSGNSTPAAAQVASSTVSPTAAPSASAKAAATATPTPSASAAAEKIPDTSVK